GGLVAGRAGEGAAGRADRAGLAVSGRARAGDRPETRSDAPGGSGHRQHPGRGRVTPGGATVSTSCPFCRIVAGDSDAHLALATDAFLAFLDARPVVKRHTLVIPREPHVTLGDLPAEKLGPFFAVVQRISTTIPTALEAHGTFVAMNNVVSQSVPHLHAHVVPRRKQDGLRGFFWPRQKYAEGAAADYAERLNRALAGSTHASGRTIPG